MKKQLSLMLILAGVCSVSVSNGQVVQTPIVVANGSAAATASGVFGQLVTAMKNANQTSGTPLYVPADYSDFLFEWTVGNVNSGSITIAPAVVGDGASGSSLYFVEGANRPFFQMNGNVNVGFIDNESVDRNAFGVYGHDSGDLSIIQTNTIFTYSGQGATQDPPPAAATLIPDTALPAYISFWQFNGFTSSTDGQIDPVRFRTFYAADTTGDVKIDYILFRIADRNNIDDRDYDDGLFLVSGPNLVPIPEPSTIGLLSIAGIAGLILIRRRFSSRKKADKAA